MIRFQNILCYVGKTITRTPAVARAADVARANDARLTLVDVLPENESGPWIVVPGQADLGELLAHQRRGELEELAAGLEGVRAEAVQRRGKPFMEITLQVLEGEHDLVIKTAQGPGNQTGGLFGTTAQHLFRKCPCPVWVVRPEDDGAPRRVLASIDPEGIGSEGEALSRSVLEMAASLARGNGASLDVLSAVWLPHASMLGGVKGGLRRQELELELERSSELVRQKLEALVASAGIEAMTPRIHTVPGRPVRVVLYAAREADVTVMGTLSRSGVAGALIGNTAEQVLQGTSASVLAVKPPGFASPIRLAA